MSTIAGKMIAITIARVTTTRYAMATISSVHDGNELHNFIRGTFHHEQLKSQELDKPYFFNHSRKSKDRTLKCPLTLQILILPEIGAFIVFQASGIINRKPVVYLSPQADQNLETLMTASCPLHCKQESYGLNTHLKRILYNHTVDIAVRHVFDGLSGCIKCKDKT